MDKEIKFPESFLWGSAISAHQTEGDNLNSDWWEWENSPGRIAELNNLVKNPEDFRSGKACDFYNRYESDFDLAKTLNQNALRLSVEWARIEPRQGEYQDRNWSIMPMSFEPCRRGESSR